MILNKWANQKFSIDLRLKKALNVFALLTLRVLLADDYILGGRSLILVLFTGVSNGEK